MWLSLAALEQSSPLAPRELLGAGLMMRPPQELQLELAPTPDLRSREYWRCVGLGVKVKLVAVFLLGIGHSFNKPSRRRPFRLFRAKITNPDKEVAPQLTISGMWQNLDCQVCGKILKGGERK